MKNWWSLTLAVGALHGAAIIRGTVVENQSGHPLARATVTVQGIGSGATAASSARTNSYGIFEFAALRPGSYVVSAARLAFAPVQYGQKRWNSSGMPITVADNDSAFLTIRLPRYGAIAGTILDENEVGLPEHDVAVYTNTRPPRLLARARTDDRGMYRLFGLQPGSYLVRSLSKLYDDGAYLPTFFRDSATVEQSRPLEVTLEQQVDHTDIHAAPGRLFTVAGRVPLSQAGQPTVSLASDTGTEIATLDSSGSFTFNPMAPGQYELLAQGPPDRLRGAMAAFQPLTVDRDLSDIRISLSPLPTVQFVFEDTKGQPIDPRQLRVMARRKDIAGDAKSDTLQVAFDEKPPAPRVARRAGTPEEPNTDPLRPVSGRVQLLPGRWDVAIAPAPTFCVVGFTPPQPGPGDRGRSDGWNEMMLPAGSQNVVKFVLSSSPGMVSGAVKNSSGDVVAGVPVFLEAYDLDPRKRLYEVRSGRTDGQGQYAFGGLAPGTYRVMGSFDYQMPDAAAMEAARAKTVKVEEGGKVVLDLEEFVIR
jgi:Carboxypeptidase regulatory-like domain